jgi:hypothetical protein
MCPILPPKLANSIKKSEETEKKNQIHRKKKFTTGTQGL